MSTIKVVHSELKEAVSDTKKVASWMTQYADDMTDLAWQAAQLSGSDRYGYVSQARQKAVQKANEARAQATAYTSFSTKLESFGEYAKEQDKNAANGVKTVISSYVGERTFLQSVGDFLYGAYVNFLDKLEGTGPFGELLAKMIRRADDWLSNAFQQAYNWFKYGDGKYFLNIVDALAGVLAGVGLMIAIATAAIGAGPILAVIAVIGVIAAGIYTITKFGDMVATTEQNTKALELSGNLFEYGDGDITAARYYGNIEGVQDYTQRYDFGDATVNNTMEFLGDSYMLVEKTSKFVANICKTALTFGSLGISHAPGTEGEFDFGRMREGVKAKILHDMGFNTNDLQDGGFKVKLKIISKTCSDFGTAGNIIDGFKTRGTVKKVFKAFGTLSSAQGLNHDTVSAGMDLAGRVPLVDAPTSDGWGFLSDLHGIWEVITGPSEPNAYQSYLNLSAAGGGGGARGFGGGGGAGGRAF